MELEGCSWLGDGASWSPISSREVEEAKNPMESHSETLDTCLLVMISVLSLIVGTEAWFTCGRPRFKPSHCRS